MADNDELEEFSLLDDDDYQVSSSSAQSNSAPQKSEQSQQLQKKPSLTAAPRGFKRAASVNKSAGPVRPKVNPVGPNRTTPRASRGLPIDDVLPTPAAKSAPMRSSVIPLLPPPEGEILDLIEEFSLDEAFNEDTILELEDEPINNGGDFSFFDDEPTTVSNDELSLDDFDFLKGEEAFELIYETGADDFAEDEDFFFEEITDEDSAAILGVTPATVELPINDEAVSFDDFALAEDDDGDFGFIEDEEDLIELAPVAASPDSDDELINDDFDDFLNNFEFTEDPLDVKPIGETPEFSPSELEYEDDDKEEDDEEDFFFEEIDPDSPYNPETFVPSWEKEAEVSSINADEAAFMDVGNLSDEEFEALIEKEARRQEETETALENDEEPQVEETMGEDDESDELEEKPKKKPKKAKPKAKAGILAMFLGFLMIPVRAYRGLSRLVWGAVSTVLQFAGKLPVIGKPFRMADKILKMIPDGALDIALPAVPVLAVSLGFLAVPGSTYDLELPDDGGAKMTNISYENNNVTATIENTGDIIAHVLPEFTIKKSSYFNPISWFSPEIIGTCSAAETAIEIGGTIEVAALCEFGEIEGIVKVDGVLL